MSMVTKLWHSFLAAVFRWLRAAGRAADRFLYRHGVTITRLAPVAGVLVFVVVLVAVFLANLPETG